MAFVITAVSTVTLKFSLLMACSILTRRSSNLLLSDLARNVAAMIPRSCIFCIKIKPSSRDSLTSCTTSSWLSRFCALSKIFSSICTILPNSTQSALRVTAVTALLAMAPIR